MSASPERDLEDRNVFQPTSAGFDNDLVIPDSLELPDDLDLHDDFDPPSGLDLVDDLVLLDSVDQPDDLDLPNNLDYYDDRSSTMSMEAPERPTKIQTVSARPDAHSAYIIPSEYSGGLACWADQLSLQWSNRDQELNKTDAHEDENDNCKDENADENADEGEDNNVDNDESKFFLDPIRDRENRQAQEDQTQVASPGLTGMSFLEPQKRARLIKDCKAFLDTAAGLDTAACYVLQTDRSLVDVLQAARCAVEVYEYIDWDS